jgi:hypothetical protein
VASQQRQRLRNRLNPYSLPKDYLLLVYENGLRSGLNALVYCIPPNPDQRQDYI